MKTIPVKILGYKRSQRYAISRSLVPAQRTFEARHPEFQLAVQEVPTAQEMLQYTAVIAFPSLMIGEKLVWVGRCPSQEESLAWLEDEIRLAEGAQP